MKKFLLIDDHAVVRSGIKGLLSEMFVGSRISEAQAGDSAVEQLKKDTYDMIMMDIQMPRTDTFGLIQYIHIQFPQARVLIFSMSSENIYAKRFLKAGAKGFISKEAPLDEIKKAINLIMNDRKYISDHLAGVLAEDSFSDKGENPFNKLSSREFEISTLLLAGHTVSDISRLLNLQSSTVGTHKSRLFEKLAVSNLLELKELALSFNL